MKKIYLYTMFAAALLASCSELESNYDSLSDKNIRFTVVSGTESRSLAGNGTHSLQQPLVATTTDGGTLYLHPMVQSIERMEQLQREAAASYTNPNGILKESRAALTTENLTAFNVVATRYAAGTLATTTPNYIHDAVATKNAKGYWETELQYIWPENDDKLAFFAYAPGDGAGITLSSASLQGAPTIDFQVQNNPANQIDLITASAIDCTSGAQARNGVPLTFSHVLTSVKFVLASELTGTLKSVTLRGLYTSAKYVYPSAANTAGTWNFSGKSVGSITFDYTGATPAEVSLFLIPQTFGDDASVEAVYNNGTKDITLMASLKNQDWTAGSSVIYKISDSEVNTLKIANITFPTLSHPGLPKTAYADGDKAGLYVVDAQGNIITNNAMLTYKGYVWSTYAVMPFSLEYDYYLYYPYSSAGLANTSNTTSGAKSVSRATTETAGEATSFFAPGIDAWTIVDQSTSNNFIASDLQIAKGKLSSVDATNIDFNMTHAMGLAQFDLGGKNIGDEYYLSTDNTYRWFESITATSSFATGGYQPYGYDTGKYLVWVKPNTVTTISSDAGETDTWETSLTFNVAANTISDKQTAYSARTTSGSSSSTQYTLQVGDILYSDGSLSHQSQSLLSGKTPVAIVFMATTNANSPVTTTKDRQANANWKHGYAMALKNVHSSGSTFGTYKWATNSNSDVSGIPNTSTSTWQTSSSDMDGYTNTTYLNSTAYPAGYAAKTTYASQATAPSNSSGWFLPSTGQWYNILVNLGGMSATPQTAVRWNNASSTAASNLNSKLSKVGSGNYDAFSSSSEYYRSNRYWSSSESNSSIVYNADFSGYGNMMYFASGDGKMYTYYVRPVLAF